MTEANKANNPKKVIIEYFDSLVNQLDIYVEKLLKKIPEENNSECGAIIRVCHETPNVESSVEIEEIEMDDRTNSDQPEEENEIKNEEENQDIKRAKIEIEENIDEEEEKSENEEEEENDQNEEIEIEEESKTQDLNTYSHLDFDEGDANERNIEDEEELEEVMYGTEQFTDPYNYNYKSAKRIHYQIEGQVQVDSTNIRDYLNKMRSLMIEDIRKEEKEAIESYNSNKAGYNFDEDGSIEEIEEELFKDRFCFLLDTASDETADIFWYNPCVKQKPRAFTMCLIITDFYVSESRQDLIEKYFKRQNEEFVADYNRNKNCSEYSLDEEHLFVQYITETIRYNLRKHNYQVQTLWLSRKSLLKLEKMDFCFANIPSVCLTEPNTFSSLKSLVIRIHQFNKDNVTDLSGLSNLEYLEMKHMHIDENAFKGLNKLIKLVLDNCTLKEITDKTFMSSQKSLKFLKIRGITFNVSLESLKSLRVLALLDIDKFDHIKSLPTQSLEVLHLNTHRLFVLIDREDIGDFFERVSLKKLPHLRLSGTDLDKMETEWFTGLTNARRLSLCYNTVESADFLKGLGLFNILELDLSINKIEKFDRTHFQGLKSLKWLNLSENPIKVIKSGVFNGLENLETLILQDIKDLVIKKDSFLGLNSLRVLDLSLSMIKSIHPKAFDHLPKLECLRVKKTNLMVKKSMLPRLMHLKEIVLTPSDLCRYKCLKQAGLCFKIIEEI